MTVRYRNVFRSSVPLRHRDGRNRANLVSLFSCCSSSNDRSPCQWHWANPTVIMGKGRYPQQRKRRKMTDSEKEQRQREKREQKERKERKEREANTSRWRGFGFVRNAAPSEENEDDEEMKEADPSMDDVINSSSGVIMIRTMTQLSSSSRTKKFLHKHFPISWRKRG